jgi:hypothetical protein
MKQQYADAVKLSKSALSGSLGAGDLVSELVALYVNGVARTIGCGSAPQLDFDAEAEMAGPLVVTLSQPLAGTATPSDLLLTSGSTVTATIPQSYVIVRADPDGGAIVITLVNLLGLQSQLVPGVYQGTVAVGKGTTIPISATRS